MTKLGFKTLFVTAAIVSSTASFAAQQATSSALYAMNNLTVNDLETTQLYGVPALNVLANNKTLSSFKNSLSTTVSVNGKLQVNRNSPGQYNGECVSFVRAIANFDGKFIQGIKVRPNEYIPKGTVVAIFKDGNYLNGSHAAIVHTIDNNGMTVIDQNWNGRGTVTYHTIKFKTYSDGTDINNAYHYSVVN